MERKRLTSRQGVGRLGFVIVLLLVIVFPVSQGPITSTSMSASTIWEGFSAG